MRVEGYQLLLAAASLEAAVDWVDKLNAAIVVSTVLDEREEPIYQTLTLGRTTTAGIRTYETQEHPGLKRKWKERRSSLNSIWLKEQVSGRGQFREEGMKQYLGFEASRLVKRSATPSCVNPAHCSCLACLNAVPRAESLVFGSGSMADSYMNATDPIAATTNDIASHPLKFKKPGARNRAASTGSRLDYARCCAKTLTFRASWNNARYLKGRHWLSMDFDGTPGRRLVLQQVFSNSRPSEERSLARLGRISRFNEVLVDPEAPPPYDRPRVSG